ncbi:MAG: hypothetical protein HYV37_03320 [Candidatus Levyibacteriota bacterium]|nr:MAG: hypothetical protein HYV37_03320 [Candidatus Levybacteria bacterium]
MENDKNTLTKKQRRVFQLGVFILLVLFMIGFFFFNQKKEEQPTLKNTTVYLQDDKLKVFDDAYSFEYPDRMSLHYPYFLVIKPGIQTTYIYNLEQKKKEKEVKEVLLDYSTIGQLYTKGKTTFLNNQDLGVLCEKGFIKSTDDVLCLTKYDVNAVQNMLITINLKTLKNRDLYVSRGILSDVKVINDKIYLGEIDTHTHKNHILVDKEPIGVPNIISTIYEMNGKPYFASFKSELNNNTESYYLIENDKVTKQKGNRIYLFK